MQNILYQENKSQMAYHITYLKNIDNIAREGLIPSQSNFNFTNMGAWSKGKTFFTTDSDGILYWINKLHENTISNYESGAWERRNWVNSLIIPVVIKFPFNRKGDQGNEEEPKRWGVDHQGMSWRDFYTYR